MTIEPLLKGLGYLESRKFIPPEADDLPASELSFALRHAKSAARGLTTRAEACRFHGAYVLQERPTTPAVPVVYLFEVKSDAAAREIHRLVWNQNVVPFLIVASPAMVRFYSGFAYDRAEDAPLRPPVRSVAAALGLLSDFTASSIDDGTVWQQWGHAVDPAQRADETLLADLKELDQCLQSEGMTRDAAHGLIGKFVYLRYLHDREILSERKLAKWNLKPQDVFSRRATLKAFRSVNTELQAWLNGSVFKLGDDAMSGVSQDHLRLVAGVFSGDSPSGQLHLDFSAYNFAHIPIETLSCVYEQFLHDTSETDKATRGKTLGAYYTPIPLADYVISELERTRPLKEGMTLLDPACGSGAFLVQCYRRLIEKKMRLEKRRLTKRELSDLLTGQIFGIDRDDDACRVAELSLILTLLDYVDPPDLENTTFKLPTLRDANIFKDDFFDAQGRWHAQLGSQKFDWLVGNPPWAEVRGKPAADHEHYHAGQWIAAHKASHPTGGNQIAEAFLWQAGSFLTNAGVCGFLVPAMTWFKKESVAFRQQFFAKREVWCLTNFANLAYVLFAGRAECPASAVFFRSEAPGSDHQVLTFAPFVAEQVANRPQKPNRRAITWNIVVNGSELREVSNAAAKAGDSLAWKLAMWGTRRDELLLSRVSKRFPAWETYSVGLELKAHQGFELRPRPSKETDELLHRPDLVGKCKADFTKLKGVGCIFSFPESAWGKISKEEAFVRVRGGLAGLGVSYPPHLVVDASRRFAIFSNDFVAIPSRQVGIAGPPASKDLLRALSLYLSSEFCLYHQFFASPQWGIDMNRADLDALKDLPVPLGLLSAIELNEWVGLQKSLAVLSAKQFSDFGWQPRDEMRFEELLQDLNARVFKLLALRPAERWLVEDFVRLHLELNKGKVTSETMRTPTEKETQLYLMTLRDCLDGFLSPTLGLHHRVEAVTGGEAAFFSIALAKSSAPVRPSVASADQPTAKHLLTIRDRLRQRHSQWVYFDRNLKVYERGVMHLFKPLQRLHWTRRQAVLDADEIIAETMSGGGE